jgi:hypothetical protein
MLPNPPIPKILNRSMALLILIFNFTEFHQFTHFMGCGVTRLQHPVVDHINITAQSIENEGNKQASPNLPFTYEKTKNELNQPTHNPREDDFDQLGGHVFVLHGYLGRISCDAWMLPTDSNLRTDGWDLPIHNFVKPCNWSLGIDDYPNKSDQRVMKCEIEGCSQNTP